MSRGMQGVTPAPRAQFAPAPDLDALANELRLLREQMAVFRAAGPPKHAPEYPVEFGENLTASEIFRSSSRVQVPFWLRKIYFTVDPAASTMRLEVMISDTNASVVDGTNVFGYLGSSPAQQIIQVPPGHYTYEMRAPSEGAGKFLKIRVQNDDAPTGRRYDCVLVAELSVEPRLAGEGS